MQRVRDRVLQSDEDEPPHYCVMFLLNLLRSLFWSNCAFGDITTKFCASWGEAVTAKCILGRVCGSEAKNIPNDVPKESANSIMYPLQTQSVILCSFYRDHDQSTS